MDIMCNDSRFEIIDKAKKHLLEATNIDTSPDEIKVLDNFLFRCWQMGWLDRYDNCDPVDIHDAISKGASRIETVMREESAKITEILYKDVHKKYDTFCGVPMEEAIEVMRMYKEGTLIHLNRSDCSWK